MAVDRQTGGVTVKGHGIDYQQLIAGEIALVTAAGLMANGNTVGLGLALDLIGLYARQSAVYGVDLGYAGAYRLLEIKRELVGDRLVLSPATTTVPPAGSKREAGQPKITRIEWLASGKLKVTLEQVQPLVSSDMSALPSALRFWLSPEDLNIAEETGRASSPREGVWSDDRRTRFEQGGTLVWKTLSERTAVPSGATHLTVELDVPEGTALGLHRLTVQRLVHMPDDAGGARWVVNGKAASSTFEVTGKLGAVALARQVNLYRDGALIKEIPYPANAVMIGAKTDAIAFSGDQRLMFIAGNGQIHILDTVSLKFTRSLNLGRAKLSSLAVAGRWLYVAESSASPQTTARLLRVAIDPAERDFFQMQEIALPSDLAGAPYGYQDLAIAYGVHTYLAVTASQQSLGVSMARSQPDSGKAFVIDLDRCVLSGGRLTPGPDAVRRIAFPDRQGKGPQFIASAGLRDGALRFVLSDALDSNSGLATVTVSLTPEGNFLAAPQAKTIRMGGDLPTTSRLDGKYQLNVQRAQSPVVVSRNGTEYALVADYFFDFRDPLFEHDTSDGRYQMGGKIGVVKDPFGRAEYLGSTTPIVSGNFSRLQVSADQQTLWADLRYWPMIDETPPPAGLLVWDLAALLDAAERNSLQKQASARPLPVDREIVNGLGVQVVVPDKYDLGKGPLTSGWVFGMAGSQMLKGTPPAPPPDPSPTPAVTRSIRYGDISRIDLVRLIKEQVAEYRQVPDDQFVGFNVDSLQVDGAALVKNGQAIVTAARENLPTLSAASRASYAEGRLNTSGIVFLAPTISDAMMLDLRAAKNLNNIYPGTITVLVSGLTIGGQRMPVDKTLSLTIQVRDFASAPERIFFGDRDLENPGYSAFALSGEVSARPQNTRLTDAQALDVWRVEQRLKYLGYPAMGYAGPGAAKYPENSTLSGTPYNLPQNFEVDGTFGEREQRALKLFEKTVRYDGNTVKRFSGENFGADGKIEASGDQRKVTLDYLNAYNAPHWMQIFAKTSVAGGRVNDQNMQGWYSTQTFTTIKKVEIYGTSWVYDLMKAKQYAPLELSGARTSRFNGTTDANLGFTPNKALGGHSTHDLGMAMDLGLNDYVSDKYQSVFGLKNTPAITIPADTAKLPKAWDYGRAITLSALLPNDMDNGKPLNNQRAATRDFLSLYWATKNDIKQLDANGNSGSEWAIVNGKTDAEKRSIQTALFRGAGKNLKPDSSVSLISQVLIGEE
ncbi:MAG TPA: hypothetical protein PJ981_15925, partial [Accumulibacter sp.]|nr:hypothetical protein [Accumulibacter sp.]